MTLLLVAPALVQTALMAIDEGWFHRRRGLPRFERLGHPVDTASVALAYAWLAAVPPTRGHAAVFAALALASCLTVTKDEWIHARVCTPGEHWLHALLFVLHPIALAGFGVLWWTHHRAPVAVALALTVGFGAYQLIAWSIPWRSISTPPTRTAAPAPSPSTR
jgi:hypothetical protein